VAALTTGIDEVVYKDTKAKEKKKKKWGSRGKCKHATGELRRLRVMYDFIQNADRSAGPKKKATNRSS